MILDDVWRVCGVIHFDLFYRGRKCTNRTWLRHKIADELKKAFDYRDFEIVLQELEMMFIGTENGDTLEHVTAHHVASLYTTQVDPRCFHNSIDELLRGTGVEMLKPKK